MVDFSNPDERRFSIPDPIVALDPDTKDYYLTEDYDPETGIPGRLTTEDEELLFQRQEATTTQLHDGICIFRVGYTVVMSHPDTFKQMLLFDHSLTSWAYHFTLLPSKRVYLHDMSFERAIGRALRIFRRYLL